MRFLVLLLLCACQSQYDVRLRFESEASRASYQRVEVAIVQSCLDQEAGAAPSGSVRSIAFGTAETVPALGDVDPGEYGLYARAIDGSCQVIAAGCTSVTLLKGGDGVLPVQLGDVRRQLCEPDTCNGGQCERADSGADVFVAMDAGPRDAAIDSPLVDVDPMDTGDASFDAGPGPSLIALYPCEEVADPRRLFDVSGNEHHGTCAGGCPSIEDGRGGGVCHFDENDGHYSVPYHSDFDPSGGFTAALWVRAADIGALLGVAYGTGSFNSWQLALSASPARSLVANYVSTDGTEAATSFADPFEPLTWHHLAWTYDGTTKVGYLDGLMMAADIETIQVDGMHNLLIGADEAAGRVEQPFTGDLDDIVLFDGALSGAEVFELFETSR